MTEIHDSPVPSSEGAGLRRCSDCKTVKALQLFSWRNKAQGTRQSRCKECFKVRMQKYNADNTEKRRETWRRYRRASYMKKKYGLTDEEYWAMYETQGRVCAICRRPDPVVHSVQERPLHIDHDHVTGAVRALLCRGCNMGIGAMGDDAARVRAAAEYLERHGDALLPCPL